MGPEGFKKVPPRTPPKAQTASKKKSERKKKKFRTLSSPFFKIHLFNPWQFSPKPPKPSSLEQFSPAFRNMKYTVRSNPLITYKGPQKQAFCNTPPPTKSLKCKPFLKNGFVYVKSQKNNQFYVSPKKNFCPWRLFWRKARINGFPWKNKKRIYKVFDLGQFKKVPPNWPVRKKNRFLSPNFFFYIIKILLSLPESLTIMKKKAPS